jgi:Recombination endonuclease VII
LYNGSTRHYHLKKKYGIGAAEVDRLTQEQGGLCAVCRSRPATQVDHDHKTGVVRGILCLYCNAAMGAFRDSPMIMTNAIKYLEIHGL